MRKTVYRLKKFRLSEISLVDRPACDIATVERIELVKRSRSPEQSRQFNQILAQENPLMTREQLNPLADSAFAHIESDVSKAAAGGAAPPALPELNQNSDVDPAVGFIAENVSGQYPPGNSIAGNPGIAGSADLRGEATAAEGDFPDMLAPGEPSKYVPIDSMPIAEDDNPVADATSLSAATSQAGNDVPLTEICDLLVLVVANILRTPQIENKKAAILAAGDDFKSALTRLVAQPDLVNRVGLSRWRERAIGIERAMRTASRKRALAKALHQLNFTWPADAAAIRILGKGDRVMGWLSRSDFQKRGAVLSAASRDRIHQARDILIGMCAGSGCGQDRALNSYLDQPTGESSAPDFGEMTIASRDAAATEPAVELGKLLDNLRRATSTLGSVADEVRKVAEASAGSIRKSEGSAKVLSVLAERIARLEAQPDNSRPQPLRTVEKATPVALAGNASDDIRLRIAELQSQAAELRKRGDDAATQKRLSEIGVEIIRLSNGMAQRVL